MSVTAGTYGTSLPSNGAAQRARPVGRVDALALTVGTKLTASALLLAAVVVVLIGAQSLLSAMQSMNRDIADMNRQLTTANRGLDQLDHVMDALPKTANHVGTVLHTVQATSRQVTTSSARIAATADSTTALAGKLATINASTARMSTAHKHAAAGTDQLAAIVTRLQTQLTPMVHAQHEQLGQTKTMRNGLDNMNDSLAYIVRALNEMSAPSTGGAMKIRAELTKETLPRIPFLTVEADPIGVFERNAFPAYTGP